MDNIQHRIRNAAGIILDSLFWTMARNNDLRKWLLLHIGNGDI
jgi:hypothetical protein